MSAEDDQPDDMSGYASADLIAIAIGDPDKHWTWYAISELHKRGTQTEFNAAVALTQSAMARERATAASILGQVGYKTGAFQNEAVETLIALLADSEDEVVAQAAFGLGHRRDAKAVPALVALIEHSDDEVRRGVFSLVTDNNAMLARFASAINSFSESGGWWNRLLTLGDHDEDELDLKKAGIFPLVHGIRSMALEHRLTDLSTVARIQRLVAAGRLTTAMGADLTDSLHFFMDLKLKVGLSELAMNRPVSAGIQMSKLCSLDRDLLKDTLEVVKRFKALMRQHFRLDMVA